MCGKACAGFEQCNGGMCSPIGNTDAGVTDGPVVLDGGGGGNEMGGGPKDTKD
jgi:hypothetical protein